MRALVVLALVVPATALGGEGRLLVSFSDRAVVEGRVAALGGEVWCWDRAHLCLVDGVGAAAMAGPGVLRVEADRVMPLAPARPTRAVTPRRSAPDADGTPDCPDPWELDAIGATAAWATTEGAGVTVAIADSGFRTSHEDLVGTSVFAADYGDGDGDPEVEYGVAVPGHGTFIAGMIAAVADNGVGRAGVAPQADLAFQKIADRDGNMYFSYAIVALAAVAEGDVGAEVVSYSLAGTSTTEAFDDAVTALGDADVLMVVAAANCPYDDCAEADNDANPMWPSNHPGAHVITVAGTLEDDRLNPASHYGATTVDLAAPGTELCSLGIGSDDDVVVADGTSYATGIVAGVAALVRGAHPDLTAAETGRVLRASVDLVPALTGKVTAGGRVNAARAVAAPMPRLSAPTSATVEGADSVALTITNAGAAGEATLVIDHGPELSIEAEGWQVDEIGPGGAAPGGVSPVADGRSVTVLVGPLAAGDNELTLQLVGEQEGDAVVSVRVLAENDGVVLAAPQVGEVDATGAPAAQILVTVTAVGGGCGCDGGGGGGILAAVVALVGLRRRGRGIVAA